jgi:hypothetical protein
MTKNVENRTRVQAGIKTGGQFAPETHGEPTGVTLTTPSPHDAVAVGVAAALVRSRAKDEIGTWQRRQDRGRRGYEHEPRDPMPLVLTELDRRAKDFETLPREEQEAVLDQLKMQGVKHLLEPGQRLGNDEVRVADGVESESANIGLALAAQKVVADAGLPGTVTMTDAGQAATTFTIEAGGTTHNLQVGPFSAIVSTEPEDGDTQTAGWLKRATVSSRAANVFVPHMSENLRVAFDTHQSRAALMSAFAASSFREAGESIGDLVPSHRSAVVRTGDFQYMLDVSGDRPVLETMDEDSDPLHPSMVDGFLNHMAAQTGHKAGETFASELREVFRDAERRLIR